MTVFNTSVQFSSAQILLLNLLMLDLLGNIDMREARLTNMRKIDIKFPKAILGL